MEFLSLSFEDVSPGETSLAAGSKEKRLYSQGRARGKGKMKNGNKTAQNYLTRTQPLSVTSSPCSLFCFHC